MKTTIKFTKYKAPIKVKEYLDKKVSSLEKLLDPKDESIILNIEIGKNSRHHRTGNIYCAEFMLHVSRKDFRAQSCETDMLSAIDKVKDDMANEVKKHKGKKKDMQRKGGRKVKEKLRTNL